MGYTRNVVSSIAWTGLARGFSKILSFFKVVFAARILGPGGFGVYAIATLVLSFLEIITDSGINAILIQNDKGLNKYLDTAWVISIVRGVLLFLLILIISKPISIFFNQPQSYELVLLISVSPLIKGFINPSEVRYQKELKFDRELIYKTPILLIDSFLSIILMLIMKNAAALVWGMIISILFELILSWIVVKPRPKLRFNKEIAKDIFRQGKWVTSTGIFVYLFTQGDDWFVGKMFGTYYLGFYQLAYKIATLPIYETANIVIRVVFPTYVKIKNDLKRLMKAYIKTTVTTFLIVIPFILFVFIFAKQLIILTFGKDWIPIAPLVRVLLIFSSLMSISGLSSGVFLSVKKQKYNSNVMLLALMVMIITIFPLSSYYGLLGVGYSVLVSWLCSLGLTLYYLNKIFK